MRPWMCVLSALVFATSFSARAATDINAMERREIEALQHRLSDAGCYAGAIDGQASAATALAVKTCPDQEPVLRIETGMHTAMINHVGVDAACRLLATGSDDKTVRLWAMPEGRLIRTFRLPIEAGNGGKIYATAVSPDGRTVAVGGWDAKAVEGKGHALDLIDIASGAVSRFGSFDNIILGVAFSRDGTRIAVSLGGRQGVRVIDRDSRREVMSDQDYGDNTYGLAFGTDGSLFAASYDGYLRHYGADLTLQAKVEAPGGLRPYAVAVDPDGGHLGIGFDDTPAVLVLDAVTLKPTMKMETGDVTGESFQSVTWTADGSQLVAGGNAAQLSGDLWKQSLLRFGSTGRRISPAVAVAASTITDLKPCGVGVVFATADPGFGLISNDQARTLQKPVTSDMRGKLDADFTVSADATSVRFGLGYGGDSAVTFDLAAGRLADASAQQDGLKPASIYGLPVEDWRDGTAPTWKGAPITLDKYETSRSLAIRPGGGGFTLGTDFALRAFDVEGDQRWSRPGPGPAWGVNFSADGRVVVAAYGDGTIRWHRWSDGQELLALFVHAPSKRWVAWTPTGYYMASPGAEDLIGWHLNRGWEQQADFFPASRFRDRYNRPDIVRAVLQTLDEGGAEQQADAAAQRRQDSRPLIERLPPVVTILAPKDGSVQAPGLIVIRYSVRSPSGSKVDRVEAFMDGAKIEARGLAPVAADAPATIDGDNGGTAILTLPMPPHDAVVSLVAYAEGKASDAAYLQLKGAVRGGDAADADTLLKPNLYALLIGVTHYDNRSFDLGYPAVDATGFGDALKAQEGRLYHHVEVKLLTDRDATAVGVKRGLTWLRKQTTSHDLAIVFAAGHGTTDAKGKFWFLPYDADPEDVAATSVSQDDIENVLFDLAGRKLLFIDACHSGAALNAGARGATDVTLALSDFAQAEGGVVAYAASTGREFSYERDEWGHGAFTKALIEGIGGRADLLHNGTITTATLDAYLENRVKELTGGQQHPVMNRPKTVPDFPIATVDH